MEKEKKPERKPIIIECHEDLYKFIEKIKEDVSYKTWGAVKPSNYEATHILAEKLKKSVVI